MKTDELFTINTRSRGDGSDPCYCVWYRREVIATFPVNDPTSSQAQDYAVLFVGYMNSLDDTTLETQIARYKSVENAPEHKMHTVLGIRVDTWKDKQTGQYIACVPEMLEAGRTEEEAIQAAAELIAVFAANVTSRQS